MTGRSWGHGNGFARPQRHVGVQHGEQRAEIPVAGRREERVNQPGVAGAALDSGHRAFEPDTRREGVRKPCWECRGSLGHPVGQRTVGHGNQGAEHASATDMSGERQ